MAVEMTKVEVATRSDLPAKKICAGRRCQKVSTFMHKMRLSHPRKLHFSLNFFGRRKIMISRPLRFCEWLEATLRTHPTPTSNCGSLLRKATKRTAASPCWTVKMPTFESKPLRKSNSLVTRLAPKVRQRPLLFFGVPFLATMVAASFGLASLTQTRYDYNATKVQTISKEEELKMKKDRKRIDIREEYFVRSYPPTLLVSTDLSADILSSAPSFGLLTCDTAETASEGG